ncbi:hypothetical protein TrRE_jg8093 [Triparma retinervis]|uniref:tRNA synthetases class I catalytic domain-containing protein n=1 Tax=Triparma retinervis TaxID=2557542 RepID=A0A9W7DLG9_9STRA|nr:hypothetical protein TrRE_jg8093 [Triparma retinervis]
MSDLADLNIVPAGRYPRATDHISDIVGMIEDLRDVGLAYEDGDGWWFDVGRKEGYGKQLVNLADIEDEKDIDADGDQDYRQGGGKVGGMPKAGDKVKNNKRDFALWKAFKEGVDIDRWVREGGRGCRAKTKGEGEGKGKCEKWGRKKQDLR